jgi:hypothetical protein
MGLNAMDHENLQRELRARFPSHPVPELRWTDEPGNPVGAWLRKLFRKEKFVNEVTLERSRRIFADRAWTDVVLPWEASQLLGYFLYIPDPGHAYYYPCLLSAAIAHPEVELLAVELAKPGMYPSVRPKGSLSESQRAFAGSLFREFVARMYEDSADGFDEFHALCLEDAVDDSTNWFLV